MTKTENTRLILDIAYLLGWRWYQKNKLCPHCGSKIGSEPRPILQENRPSGAEWEEVEEPEWEFAIAELQYHWTTIPKWNKSWDDAMSLAKIVIDKGWNFQVGYHPAIKKWSCSIELESVTLYAADSSGPTAICKAFYDWMRKWNYENG